MKISMAWLTEKSACEPGKKWFEQRFVDGGELEDVLKAAAADGHLSYAMWLLKTARLVVGIAPMVEAAVKCVFNRVDWKAKSEYKKGGNAASQGDDSNAASQGDDSNAASQGYASNAASQGDDSNAASQGWESRSSSKGERTVSASFGRNSKSRAEKGSWIILDEWKEFPDGWHRVNVKTVAVDGKKIKADTYYTLKGGKFVEAEG